MIITSGSPLTFNTEGTASQTGSIVLQDGKVLLYGRQKAAIATLNNYSATFGAEVEFASVIRRVVYLAAANTLVFVFSGTVIVGVISGSTITTGTAVTYNTSVATDLDATLIGDILFLVYRKTSPVGVLAHAGTVSGSTVTFGTAVVVEAVTAQDPSATYDADSGKVAVIYRLAGSPYTGRAASCVLTGTSIVASTPITYDTVRHLNYSAVLVPGTSKIIFSYMRDMAAGLRAVVFDLSGADITCGTAALVDADGTSNIFSIYSPSIGAVIAAYNTNIDSSGYARVLTISGTDVAASEPSIFGTADALTHGSICYHSALDVVILSYSNFFDSDLTTLAGLKYVGSTLTVVGPEAISAIATGWDAVSYSQGTIISTTRNPSTGDGLLILSTISPGQFWTNFNGQTEIV